MPSQRVSPRVSSPLAPLPARRAGVERASKARGGASSERRSPQGDVADAQETSSTADDSSAANTSTDAGPSPDGSGDVYRTHGTQGSGHSWAGSVKALLPASAQRDAHTLMDVPAASRAIATLPALQLSSLNETSVRAQRFAPLVFCQEDALPPALTLQAGHAARFALSFARAAGDVAERPDVTDPRHCSPLTTRLTVDATTLGHALIERLADAGPAGLAGLPANDFLGVWGAKKDEPSIVQQPYCAGSTPTPPFVLLPHTPRAGDLFHLPGITNLGVHTSGETSDFHPVTYLAYEPALAGFWSSAALACPTNVLVSRWRWLENLRGERPIVAAAPTALESSWPESTTAEQDVAQSLADAEAVTAHAQGLTGQMNALKAEVQQLEASLASLQRQLAQGPQQTGRPLYTINAPAFAAPSLGTSQAVQVGGLGLQVAALVLACLLTMRLFRAPVSARGAQAA